MDAKDQNLEFTEKDAVSFWEMTSLFSTDSDELLLMNGLFWSFLFGGSFPTMVVIFGQMVDDLGGISIGNGENPMKKNAIIMIYVALLTFFTSSMYIVCLGIFSESVAHKLKIKYFNKALQKDAAFYDEQNPTEMASKINKEASAVKRGCSEKIGNINMSISAFLLGYIAAFYFGWKFSLILLAGLPVLGFSGALMAWSMNAGTLEQMKAYAQSAGYAEQALQSIRIVHTYGNEILEYMNYSKYLDRAR